MTTLTVYHLARCRPTDLRSSDVDQKFVDLAANLNWLKAQGVTIGWLGRCRGPAHIAADDTIRQISHECEGDDLPAFKANRDPKATARYSFRAEPAKGLGPAAPKLEIIKKLRELISDRPQAEAAGYDRLRSSRHHAARHWERSSDDSIDHAVGAPRTTEDLDHDAASVHAGCGSPPVAGETAQCITPWGRATNAILAATGPTHPILAARAARAARAATETPEIARMLDSLATRAACAPRPAPY